MSHQYQLLGRLETGELAELYRAAREGSSPVVIKLFHPHTSDVGYALAVADTARLLNEVLHPGLAHVVEIGLVRHRLAVVREDVGRFNLGTALQRLHTKEVLLAPALALSWVIELLDLVQQAHQAGVVHGALTPGNVMLTPEGRPAVCDFGALAALNSVPALKKNFGPRGRNNYRAPEISQSEMVSVQSDLYSLGAITYELLTLREPSAGAAAMSTRREVIPPPSRLDRRINARLDPIVMRAIEPVPARRFKTCAEFASALRDFLSNTGGLPSRNDLQRFTNDLFPKEVSVEAMGPVPFGDHFGLKEVDGAELEKAEERSVVVPARQAFSGGEVSSTAPTSEAIPAFHELAPWAGRSDRRKTDEMLAPSDRSSLSWDAPPSEAPVARSRPGVLQANALATLKRVRVAQDFEPGAGAGESKLTPELPLLEAPSGKIEAPERAEPSSHYAAIPAESVRTDVPMVRDADGRLRRMITEERKLELIHRKSARMLVVAGGFVVVGLLIFTVALWRRGRGRTPSPPAKALVRAEPPRPPPEPRPKEAPKPLAPQGAKIDCYDPPPKKGAAMLTVSSRAAIKAELDGQRLCALERVLVSPGPHSIVVTDLRTGTKEEHKLRFVAGANTRLEIFVRGSR